MVYRRVTSLVDDEERNKRNTKETRTSGEKARDTHEIHYRYFFIPWWSRDSVRPTARVCRYMGPPAAPAPAGCYTTVMCLRCNEFIGHRRRVSCRTRKQMDYKGNQNHKTARLEKIKRKELGRNVRSIGNVGFVEVSICY